MPFNRREILYKHYLEQIAHEWKWEVIKAECAKNTEPSEDESNVLIGRCYLGTVFSVMPSGKFYMPWTTNQTRADETRDAAYMDALEATAKEHGLWIENGDGDPCDMFACCSIDAPTNDEDEEE